MNAFFQEGIFQEESLADLSYLGLESLPGDLLNEFSNKDSVVADHFPQNNYGIPSLEDDAKDMTMTGDADTVYSGFFDNDELNDMTGDGNADVATAATDFVFSQHLHTSQPEAQASAHQSMGYIELTSSSAYFCPPQPTQPSCSLPPGHTGVGKATGVTTAAGAGVSSSTGARRNTSRSRKGEKRGKKSVAPAVLKPWRTWSFARTEKGVPKAIKRQLESNNFLLLHCTNPMCSHWTIAFSRRRKNQPKSEHTLFGGAQLILKWPFDPTTANWQPASLPWICGFQCTTIKHSPPVSFVCFNCNNPTSPLEVYWPQEFESRAGTVDVVTGYTPIPNEWGAGFVTEQRQPSGGYCYHLSFPSSN